MQMGAEFAVTNIDDVTTICFIIQMALLLSWYQQNVSADGVRACVCV